MKFIANVLNSQGNFLFLNKLFNLGECISRPFVQVTLIVTERHCHNVVEPRSVRDLVRLIMRPYGARKLIKLHSENIASIFTPFRLFFRDPGAQ